MNNVQIAEHTGKLKFRYIAASLVEGIQSPADCPLPLYSDPSQGKNVLLTGNTHESLRHIDTVHTIANITLTAMFQGKTWDLNEFASHVAATSGDRVRRYGASASFLVVEASHEEDGARIGPIGQSDDREYCLAIANGFRDEVETRHKTFWTSHRPFCLLQCQP
jgi:hypothetical protein